MTGSLGHCSFGHWRRPQFYDAGIFGSPKRATGKEQNQIYSKRSIEEDDDPWIVEDICGALFAEDEYPTDESSFGEGGQSDRSEKVSENQSIGSTALKDDCNRAPDWSNSQRESYILLSPDTKQFDRVTHEVKTHESTSQSKTAASCSGRSKPPTKLLKDALRKKIKLKPEAAASGTADSPSLNRIFCNDMLGLNSGRPERRSPHRPPVSLEARLERWRHRFSSIMDLAEKRCNMFSADKKPRDIGSFEGVPQVVHVETLQPAKPEIAPMPELLEEYLPVIEEYVAMHPPLPRHKQEDKDSDNLSWASFITSTKSHNVTERYQVGSLVKGRQDQCEVKGLASLTKAPEIISNDERNQADSLDAASKYKFEAEDRPSSIKASLVNRSLSVPFDEQATDDESDSVKKPDRYRTRPVDPPRRTSEANRATKANCPELSTEKLSKEAGGVNHEKEARFDKEAPGSPMMDQFLSEHESLCVMFAFPPHSSEVSTLKKVGRDDDTDLYVDGPCPSLADSHWIPCQVDEERRRTDDQKNDCQGVSFPAKATGTSEAVGVAILNENHEVIVIRYPSLLDIDDDRMLSAGSMSNSSTLGGKSDQSRLVNLQAPVVHNPTELDEWGYAPDNQGDKHRCKESRRWAGRSLPAPFKREVWQHKLSLLQASLQSVLNCPIQRDFDDYSVTARGSDTESDCSSSLGGEEFVSVAEACENGGDPKRFG